MYTSAGAVVRTMNEVTVRDNPSLSTVHAPSSAGEIVELAYAGDPHAFEIYKIIREGLGTGIANSSVF